MKLKTKLIPLATIATCAAAITPFAVSCGANTGVSSLLNMQEPTFYQYEPQDSGYLEEKEATTLYVDYMSSNPNALAIDLKWGIYQNWMSFYENSNYAYVPTLSSRNKNFEIFNSKLTKLDVSVSKAKFGNVRINNPSSGKESEDFPTISFKMTVDAEAQVTTTYGLNRNVTTTHNIKVSSSANYRNMLFFAYPATRNDKTHGNAKDPSEMPVDTTKPGWWITISEDSATQYNYRHNFSDWGIDYEFDFDDQIVKTDIAERKTWISSKTAKFGSTVDTYIELENLIFYKTYGYDDSGVDLEDQDLAWKSWFTQSPESVLANCVLLDNVSHYLGKCHSNAYIYVPDNLTAECEIGSTNVELKGAYFYPDDTFTIDDADKLVLTLDPKNIGGVSQNLSLPEKSGNYDTDLPRPVLLIEGKSLNGCVDWEQWALTKGAAPLTIPATLSRPLIEADLGVPGNLEFAVNEKGSLGFTLINTETGYYRDGTIQLGDGLGIVYLTK